MKKLLLLCLAGILLSGCALFQDGDLPENKLYNATVGYMVTLKAVLAYETLPRCVSTPTLEARSLVLCSDQGAVDIIRVSDEAAKTALDLFGTGIPTNPGIEALRLQIAADRIKLNSDEV